jgi:Tol biopolymer transport system component
MSRFLRPQFAAILAILMLTLALAPAASATYQGRNGLIAFQANVGDNGPQIFTVRSNGRQLRQITHVDGVAALPDWSPDGRRIAFTLNECAIALMDADGGNLHEVASDPDLCLGDASFTPEGARLVYTRFDPALEVEQIWSMKTDGSDQQFITDAGGPDPNVSPDGQKISF